MAKSTALAVVPDVEAEEPEEHIPEGYDTAALFLEEARERYTEGADSARENNDATLDDLQFFTGEQWDPTVKAWRQRMGRAVISINTLPQYVAQVVGDIRINRPAIKVRPAEGADKETADTREGLIRFIERKSGASQVYSNAGQSQVAGGIGYFRISLQYAANDVFDQDIIIGAIPNPLSVVIDPMSTEPTGKDAKWLFVADEMSRKDFEAAYPDVSPSDLGDGAYTGGWYERDTVRICEYWRMKQRPVTLALLDDGTIHNIEDIPEGQVPLKTRDTFESYACRYLITGNDILEGPYELKIDRIPVFRVLGWEQMVGEKRVRWGLVRFAKDAARNKNLWRSVSADLVGGSARSQWLAEDKAIEGYEDDFREAHTSGDPLLIYKSGAAMPQKVPPPSIPAGILNEAALCSQDLKDVTGLHDASLGIQSNETSGVAINARQREGDVATYVYHDNLHSAISECGRVANDLIPIAYDTARTIMIVGEDEKVKAQRINDPSHEESINLGLGKYDIAVETGPSYSTKRAEAAQSMMQFVQSVPQAAAITGDLIAASQDWPMASTFAERLQKALPPQFQDKDEKQPPTPEQQQQMQAQQQQQQMAQQAAGIEMGAKKADADKKEADARKANAEAAKAEFDLAQLTGAVDQAIVQHAQELAARMVFGDQGPAPSPQGFDPGMGQPPQDQAPFAHGVNPGQFGGDANAQPDMGTGGGFAPDGMQGPQ